MRHSAIEKNDNTNRKGSRGVMRQIINAMFGAIDQTVVDSIASLTGLNAVDIVRTIDYFKNWYYFAKHKESDPYPSADQQLLKNAVVVLYAIAAPCIHRNAATIVAKQMKMRAEYVMQVSRAMFIRLAKDCEAYLRSDGAPEIFAISYFEKKVIARILTDEKFAERICQSIHDAFSDAECTRNNIFREIEFEFVAGFLADDMLFDVACPDINEDIQNKLNSVRMTYGRFREKLFCIEEEVTRGIYNFMFHEKVPENWFNLGMSKLQVAEWIEQIIR